MRILYVIPSFQHPRVRGPTRHYHFVRALSRHHRITLLGLHRTEPDAEAVAEMESCVERMLLFDACGLSGNGRTSNGGPAGRLRKSWHLRRGVGWMRRAFDRLRSSQRYDLVVFHGKSVFGVIRRCTDLPMVVDFCDATSMRIRQKMQHAGPVRRPLLAARYLQVRQTERRLLEKTRQLAFISPRDREAVLGPDGSGEILPNGVDHDYWKPSSGRPPRHRIVFTGVMDYAPNDDAARYLIEEIAPLVRRAVPRLEVVIVGRDPTARLQQMADRHPDVQVTGFVDDVRPYLQQAAVFVAPMRYASGTQNKVLEAFSMQVPVVTTPAAADGVRVSSETEPPLRVAENPQLFAEQVIRLLSNERERRELGAAGRRYVEEHFDWSRSGEKLETMCRTAVEARSRRTAKEREPVL